MLRVIWRVLPMFGAMLLLSGLLRADDGKDRPLADRLDALLAKEFPADVPGAAVLVIHQGKVLLEKGYGLADRDKKTPIAPTTNFDLASVSKQFTALAIMILADRKQLALDDDVCKYVPELQASAGPRPIRIRDLLNHTSGLPDYLSFWRQKFDNFAKVTNDDVAGLIKDRKRDFLPGAKFDYSNTNYALLPVIVRKVTGKRFGTFMTDEVFRPLGMERTVVVDDLAVAISERATGYRWWPVLGWRKAALDGPICGDGNIFSNLHDLAKWDAAVTVGKLARPETWRLALTSGKLDDGSEAGYGFGWAIGTRAGKPIHEHGGGWTGTRTYIGRWPDDRLTIVILSNNESTDRRKLRTAITDLVLGMNP